MFSMSKEVSGAWGKSVLPFKRRMWLANWSSEFLKYYRHGQQQKLTKDKIELFFIKRSQTLLYQISIGGVIFRIYCVKFLKLLNGSFLTNKVRSFVGKFEVVSELTEKLTAWRGGTFKSSRCFGVLNWERTWNFFVFLVLVSVF